jgi:hypothetical protein
VYRTLRGSAVALLALVLALSATLPAGAAQASRVLPRRDKTLPSFTRSEARDVLARARRALRPDTRRVRSREAIGNGPDTDITMTLRDLALARTALSSGDRREADAILARPSDPQGDPDIPVVYPPENGANPRGHYCTAGLVVCVHWVGGTSDPNRISSTDSDSDGIPNYVETVYTTMARVWNTETGTLGYNAPLADDGTSSDTNNPDGRIDVYLADLRSRGLYGYCAPDGPNDASSHQTGYCVLDNDYVNYGTAPINALRATAAHEFFHAVQFGYDVGEDLWFMEGTATWMEDEVYDSINDNYQYLPTSAIRYPRTSLDYTGDTFAYGSFIFFKYASERRGVSIVRRFWNAAVGHPTSLQAIYGIVGASAWPAFFATFGSWNTLPRHSYSERAGYPSPRWWLKKTLTRRSSSTGWHSTKINHLGNAPVFVAPGKSLSTRKRLLVEVNGPRRSLGTAALLQRRYRDGRVTHTMITLNTSGNARTLVHFNRKVLSGIAVILSNTSRSGSGHTFKTRATLR